MDYSKLDKEDFDAIVTGELTHYAIWLEDELNAIICDYFIDKKERIDDFQRLFLHRDGLTFQDKIEIVRGMIPLFGQLAVTLNLKNVLKEIEEFKSWRNAMAHGRDVSRDGSLNLKIETVSRSGKQAIKDITPKSHEETCKKVEILLQSISYAREQLKKHDK